MIACLHLMKAQNCATLFPIAIGIESGTVIKETTNDFYFMNFQSAELTQQVAQTARDFAQQHIKPHVMEWDEIGRAHV